VSWVKRKGGPENTHKTCNGRNKGSDAGEKGAQGYGEIKTEAISAETGNPYYRGFFVCLPDGLGIKGSTITDNRKKGKEWQVNIKRDREGKTGQVGLKRLYLCVKNQRSATRNRQLRKETTKGSQQSHLVKVSDGRGGPP